MEEAAAVRRAALDAVQDVVPADLASRLESFVTDGSLVPGVLALLSAEAAAGEPPEALHSQAAGVQLIYDGLRLTRALAHEEPWTDADRDRDHADVDILAADVLVSRGFYLLAHTDAAGTAVEVVRTFGRDQTRRESAEDPRSVDRDLEADVLALAVVTGVTAVGAEVPDGHREFAGDLASEARSAADGSGGPPHGEEGFPAPESLFDDGVPDRLSGLAEGTSGGRPLNRND